MYQIGGSKEAKRKSKTTRLLARYDAALEAYLFKGTRPPSEHAEIIDAYQTARKLLRDHINEV